MLDYAEAAKRTNAWACYDCGKCTASCPISRSGADYSPRKHVLATNLGQKERLLQEKSLFSCLTCSLCDTRCPARVDYTDLVLSLRSLAHTEGAEPECPHGGALQSVMRLMARGGTQQNRMDWVNNKINIEERKGEVFYWTGCAMYYDAFFTDYKVNALGGTRSAILAMNRLGVSPVVSADERCCGHDLLWNGDRKNFELLAKHNVELVKKSGAKTLVVSCAECLRVWRKDYVPFFDGPMPRAVHISEYLSERWNELPIQTNGTPRKQLKVTYQDPCRLGRHLGIFETPRKVLGSLPGVELIEMGKSGANATCCAGGTWSNCDRFAKQIQSQRLREAKETGADVMATACPKCQVHLRCAMNDPNMDLDIDMKDIAELVADRLE